MRSIHICDMSVMDIGLVAFCARTRKLRPISSFNFVRRGPIKHDSGYVEGLLRRRSDERPAILGAKLYVKARTWERVG